MNEGFTAQLFQGVKFVRVSLGSPMRMSVVYYFYNKPDGTVVAETSPIESFLSGLALPGYDLVVDTLYATASGVFSIRRLLIR